MRCGLQQHLSALLYIKSQNALHITVTRQVSNSTATLQHARSHCVGYLHRRHNNNSFNI